MKKSLRIGSCQTPEIIADINASVRCILDFSIQAESQHVDLLLFPECFLQGYVIDEEHFTKYAVDLNSTSFKKVLQSLKDIKSTIVIGLIEKSKEKYYNSAAVIKDGKIQGVYRKTHLLPGESLFHAGNSYPVFEIKGIKYGINICYDTQFAESAHKLAEKGSRFLLVPAQNMLKIKSAEKWKDLHNIMRSERAKETHMWLISSDVTGKRGDTHIAYGPTSVIDPKGKVIAQVPLKSVGMITYEIPLLNPYK